jgi:hypothetical protein
VTEAVDARESKEEDDAEYGGATPPGLVESAPEAGEALARPKRRRSRRRRKGQASAAPGEQATTVATATPAVLEPEAAAVSLQAEPATMQQDGSSAALEAAQNGGPASAAPAPAAPGRKKRRGTAQPRARRFPLAREVREQLRRERQMALDTRDPLAIRLALDRYDVITAVLEGFSDDAEVDLDSITLGISQAAKALGYTPFQVREMIKQRKLAAHKVNNQWRIPLRLVW